MAPCVTSVFAGANLTGEDPGDRGVFGVRYLLPFLIRSQAWVDTDGELLPAPSRGFAALFSVFAAGQGAPIETHLVSRTSSAVGSFSLGGIFRNSS